MGLDGSSSSSVEFKGLDLPLEWKLSKLQDLFSIQQGKALSKKHRTGKSPYPFLRTANILWGKLELTTLDEMDFTEQERERYTLIPGDLLVCEGGDIGRTAIWNGEIQNCYFQNHIHRLRTDRDDVVPRFYMYWMQAAIKQLKLYSGEGNVTTIANLSKSRLGSFIVPLPPLSEQSAISEILSMVQNAIGSTEKVISATKILKNSLMQYLFTYGPVPIDQADQVPLKETEIGMIPAHWEVVCLSELIDRRNDPINPTTVSDTRYVGLEHIEPGKTYIKNWGTADQVKSMKSGFLAGDILYGKLRPYLDKAAIAEWAGICSTDILVFKATGGVRSYFIVDLLHREAFIKYATSTMSGVNHPRTSWGAICKYQAPLPPISEQEIIADLMQRLDDKILSEEKKKSSLESFFGSILHHLMTGKIRVNDLVMPEEIGVS